MSLQKSMNSTKSTDDRKARRHRLVVRILGRLAAVGVAVVSFYPVQTSATIVRTQSDRRLWETVGDRSAPLIWQWENAADFAELVFSNRLTGAVSTVNVSRGSDATHGCCAHPSQDRETIVDVSLVQKAGGAEVSRETATLAYVDGAGGGPITVRANPGTRAWERVRDPRVYAIDPAWRGESGESGYDIAWPINLGLTIILR